MTVTNQNDATKERAWLQRLNITNFRGVKSGLIEGLAPLSVFVGRNGQGKSTILEAAFIFATAPEVRTFVHAITRRGWSGPAMWEFITPVSMSPRYVPGQTFQFSISGAVRRDDKAASTELKVDCSVTRTFDPKIAEAARVEGLINPDVQVNVALTGDRMGTMTAMVGTDGRLSRPTVVSGSSVQCLDGAALLDADTFRRPQQITASVSGATVGGWLEAALSFARRVVPGLSDIRIVERHGTSLTMLYYGEGKPSIPFHVAGDGVRRLIELSLGVLGGPTGIIAIEEPENFLHPGSRRVCAEVIWAAVNRGEQVMVSTHNLEFLDDLLGVNGQRPQDMDNVAIFRTSLIDDVLTTVRISGKDAKDSREILGQDLRA